MKSLIMKYVKPFKSQDIPEEYRNIKNLKDKPDSYFVKGLKVYVINNLPYVRYIQDKNGGWTDDMIRCLDQLCTVLEVDYDKLILVKTPWGKKWLFHRAVLKSAVDEHKEIFDCIENGDLDELMRVIGTNTLNILNEDGRTPINLACFLGKKDIVVFLCEINADITIADKCGKTPIDNSNSQLEILKILSDKYPNSMQVAQNSRQELENIGNDNKKEIFENDLNNSSNKYKTSYTEETIQSKKSEKNETYKVNKCNKINLEESSNHMNDDSIFSLPDVPYTLYRTDLKIIKHEVPKLNESIQTLTSHFEIDYPPVDNDVIHSTIKFETSNSEIKFEESLKKLRLICKKCNKHSANYRASCGHCYCTACYESIQFCSICNETFDGEGLRIFV